MNRRQFLTYSSCALAGALRAETVSPKLRRIGISTWSFHSLFPATHERDAGPLTHPMDARDFPAMIADRYHVHQLEIVAPHIDANSPAYIRELRQRLDAAHSRLVNIPLDIKELGTGGGLSDTDPKVRERAISACTKWIDVAQQLGAKSVRCDPGKINRADLSPTISSYRTLASYAAPKQMYVIIENHGGVGSEHPEDLVKIFQAAGSHCGALPDMGNFPDEETRERGLPLLYPYAKTVSHAKGLNFDASGKETGFDFPKAMHAARGAGFKGVYSIEYEGSGDPYQGVQHVIDELLASI